MFDVIVAGAGPVGSHIARKMAERGYSVAVFEEHDVIGEPVQCTGIIGAECVNRYRIPRDVISTESKSAKFYSPSGRYIRLAKDEVQAYIVDRRAMDAHFAKKAQLLGAEYHLSSRITDVKKEDAKIVLRVEHDGGSAHFEARTLVIASGFGTRLPYRLGLGRFGDWIAGAQMEVETGGIDEVEVYFSQTLAPGFFGWLVPTGQGRGLAGLFARSAPRRHLDRLIKALKKEGKVTGEGKVTSGGIPLKTLPRTYRERLLVVGDAAGQVKPTTGGGVYYGLICADIAVDTLCRALLRDDYSDKTFGLYEKTWKKSIGRELKIGYLARRLYQKLSDKQIETLFRMLDKNRIYQAMLNSDQMRFDWHGGLLLKWLKYMGPWRYFFGWRKDRS